MKRMSCLLGLIVMLGACADDETAAYCSGAGQAVCGSICVDATTDRLHCGGCNNSCGDGEVCSEGVCSGACGAGQTQCDGNCVDIQTNATNCGGCGNVCQGGATCSAGACACSGGLAYCNGTCVQLQSDDMNCGACSNQCRNEQICLSGACEAMAPELCNGQDDDLDGLTDEGADGNPLTQSCDNLCGPGIETCTNGSFTGCTAPPPTEEVCDGEDNDCDGIKDEGVTTTYYEDFDGDGFGDPDLVFSTEACEQPREASPNGGVYVTDNTDCDDLEPTANPDADESCEDEIDNDCDGDVNEDCPCAPIGEIEECGSDVGVCGVGMRECLDTGWSECAGDTFAAPGIEMCSGEDEDCDANIDERLGNDIFEQDGLNDTCETAVMLVDAEQNGDAVEVLANLYHGDPDADQDSDWFVITADEGTSLCLPGTRECGFYFGTQLRVPPDTRDDYIVCIHEGECGDFDSSICSTDDDGPVFDEETHSWQLVGTWDGRCGFDDSKTLFIEIRYDRQALNHCSDYGLDLEFAYTDEDCD